jgi:transposase
MANVLKDEKKQQIIALGRLGWSLRKIQEATHVRRETISAYLKAAGIEIWPPGRWRRRSKSKAAIQVTTGSDEAHRNGVRVSPAKPAIQVITGFGVGLSESAPEKQTSKASASACEPYREIIELGLGRGRNAVAIWQDLVSDHGFQGGYQSVRRFAVKLRGSQIPQARAVIFTVPGEEAQVDYGQGPMVRESQSGKYRRTRLFVLALGYSRKAVRHKTRQGLPRLRFHFRKAAYEKLCSTLLGKTILFTDHGDDWSDEKIVLGYRAQHHVEGDFRHLKNPLYLSFRPTFHWTDQKLRVHAFYCVLALMILSLLRRQLTQAGIPVSMVNMMKQLTNIQEVTVLYPAAQRGQEPIARTVLSTMNARQQKMFTTLGLEHSRNH